MGLIKGNNIQQNRENHVRFSKHIKTPLTWDIIIQSCVNNEHIHNQLHNSKQNRENNIKFANQMQPSGHEFNLLKASAASNKVGSPSKQ